MNLSGIPSKAFTSDKDGVNNVPSGLKWYQAGTVPPADAHELKSTQLSRAMDGKQANENEEFVLTQSEWSALDVQDLRADHYITSVGYIFVPADTTPSYKFAVLEQSFPSTKNGTKNGTKNILSPKRGHTSVSIIYAKRLCFPSA